MAAQLLPVEIVFVAREAIMESFMNRAYAQAALARRGWSPFNRATLNEPEILKTATEQVQKERDAVLRCRGINDPLAAPPPPTQRDLLTTGSGFLAGGAAAANNLQQSAADLDYLGFTASSIMTLAEAAKNKNDGRNYCHSLTFSSCFLSTCLLDLLLS